MRNVWPNFRTSKERTDWYRNVYLKCKHWRQFSKAYRTAHPYCEWCDFRESQDCHHTRLGYEVLGFEDHHDGSVVALCKACHAYHHNSERVTKVIDAAQRVMAFMSLA